jgi:uncharacterized damage-inducible protein DinB
MIHIKIIMSTVSIKELFLGEFDCEATTTRKMLERVPFEKFDWTPHAKSTPLGRLANHVATMPRLVPDIINTDKHTFGRTTPLEVKSTADIVAEFDRLAHAAREALAGTTDGHLAGHWELFFGDREIFKGHRATAFESLFMDHLIHHRAQLGVYLRLNDVPIPGSYGPSADEPSM